MEDKEQTSYSEDRNDDFGLPEVKYEPIDREDEDPPAFEEPKYYEEEEEESSSKAGWIVAGILTIVLLAGLSVYLFLFDGLAQLGWGDEPEPAPVTKVVEPEATPEPEPDPDPEPVPSEPEVDPLAPYDDIVTISEPAGRSYIVVSSFVDSDMAMDFSQQMLEQGVGTRILAPTQRAPLMHRVAVADYDSFEAAMADLENFRTTYGEKSWVLKY